MSNSPFASQENTRTFLRESCIFMKSNFRFFSTLLHFSPKHSLGKIKLQTRDGVGVLQIVKYPYQYDILDKLHTQYHLLAPTINYYISIESK